MKRALVLLLLPLAFSCQRSSPTEPYRGSYVQATVTENGTSSGISGATLEVRRSETGPVLDSAKTDASGVATIPVPPGSYWLTVVPPAGYSYPPGIGAASSFCSVGDGQTLAIKVPLVRT